MKSQMQTTCSAWSAQPNDIADIKFQLLWGDVSFVQVFLPDSVSATCILFLVRAFSVPHV